MNKTRKPESQSDQYLRLINDMLTDKTFDKSAEFLRSVRTFIEANNYITAVQVRSINNIYMKFSEKN